MAILFEDYFFGRPEFGIKEAITILERIREEPREFEVANLIKTLSDQNENKNKPEVNNIENLVSSSEIKCREYQNENVSYSGMASSEKTANTFTQQVSPEFKIYEMKNKVGKYPRKSSPQITNAIYDNKIAQWNKLSDEELANKRLYVDLTQRRPEILNSPLFQTKVITTRSTDEKKIEDNFVEEKTVNFEYQGESQFKCETCFKPFSKKSYLQRHQKVHANDEKFKCLLCLKTFADNSNLKRHYLYLHSGNKMFKCTICAMTFVENSGLKRHYLYKHSNEEEKRYRCKICSKKFVENGGLKRHILYKHSGEIGKRYKCTICSKQFVEHWMLKRHCLYKHSGGMGKRFKCRICSKEFVENGGLKRHLNVHL
ncbi:zinc finger protein 888-like [Diabrotica virgifera virgifera]|uniref:C2H2-type domain-containing protein n=1 Tax=Diabrotica virgifera virgifera TaxID=50390 RepID=A0ABM5KPV2_DIAVI|nr:zinc finger protein 888-like [Diabrotica virgifera virgifera]